MIQLHPDYLLFETSQGQIIPCSAELIAVELIGDAAGNLDPELVKQAAAAVLHYFRQDLGWTTVTVGEFSRALAEALNSLGIRIEPDDEAEEQGPICSYDLRRLLCGRDKALELGFFPLLRQELRCRLERSPQVLRFHGLRSCVKELVGAKRWSNRCQTLNDQIVEYLRACFATESASSSCELVIR
ncbi:MAG: hypothetical protein U1G07_20525 [Verrucomicrobiota bacterium]